MLLEEIKKLRTQRLILTLIILTQSISFIGLSFKTNLYYLSSESPIQLKESSEFEKKEFFIRSFLHAKFQSGNIDKYLAPDLRIKAIDIVYRINQILINKNAIQVEILIGEELKKALIAIIVEEKPIMFKKPYSYWVIGYEEKYL